MKKPNLIVIAAVIALIAAVAVLAAVMPQNRELPEDAPNLTATVSPVPDAEPTAEPTAEPAAEPTAEPDPQETRSIIEVPAKAYLVVSVGGTLYEPLPLTGEGVFTVTQDENTANTIHVTPDSIWMEHSTCDNQDCVDQGVVSLDNMDSRVLSNMVICLPNQVVLELHTPETLAETFGVTP